MRRLALPLCLATVAACAGPSPLPLISGGARPGTHAPRLDPTQAARERVVAEAKNLAGGGSLKVGGLTFDDDPVGFVRAAYWTIGVDLFAPGPAGDARADGMQILYRSLAERDELHYETPRAGDLLFLDGPRSTSALYPAQVAIVERVESDGTITALGRFLDGPQRVRVNLRRPTVVDEKRGRRINDVVASEAPVPIASLFRAFADPF